MPDSLPPSIRALYAQFTEADPKKRPTFAQIVEVFDQLELEEEIVYASLDDIVSQFSASNDRAPSHPYLSRPWYPGSTWNDISYDDSVRGT